LPELPEAQSVAAVRRLLMGLLDRATQNELLSIFVCAETTSGGYTHVRTAPENAFAMAGFIQASMSDLAAERFYEDELEEIEVEDLEEDEKDDDDTAD
jgi:hypothetical protein